MENGGAKLFSNLRLSGGCATLEKRYIPLPKGGASLLDSSLCYMNIRTFFSGVSFLAAVISSVTVLTAETAVVPKPGDLRTAGTVDFPVSCAPAVQAEFTRGVALLHSFFYEESRRNFTGVAEKDPNCAKAHWGIAKTWWHPIWTPPTPEEMKAGKAAADKALVM
jgi:hypothetical protein